MMWAFVNFRFAGTHCWPDAPDGPEEILRNPHRHEFHATVWVEQMHDDRDIEFLLLKRKLVEGCGLGGDMEHNSCEMMCRTIYDFVQTLVAKGRAIRVQVTEDGENGALFE